MKVFVIQLLNCLLLSIITRSSSIVIDALQQGQSLKVGDTLSSPIGTFELGFFSFGDSKTDYYLGVWYKNISPRTIVWVANREIPLRDTAGALNITSRGALVITNGTNYVIWWTNVAGVEQNNLVAVLLESGNLVVTNGSDSTTTRNFLWQSFDFAGDTFLPGMKLGYNFKTGHENSLSSWKSTENPAPGEYSFHVDHAGYPQLVLRKGSRILFRMGSWNGIRFTGVPQLKQLPTYRYEFVLNENEVYFDYTIPDRSLFYRYEVNPSGLAQGFTWNERENDWEVFGTTQADQCENYALCGAYSNCDMTNTPICFCFDGFVPKNETEWNSGDWSNGCVGNTQLGCSNNNNDGFLKVSGIKLPDTSLSWYDKNIDLVECEGLCLKNCSCTAYASLNIADGSGCLTWSGELIDARTLSDNGQDIYIRIASSELDRIRRANSSDKKQKIIIASSVTLGVSVLLIIGAALCIQRRNHFKNGKATKLYKNEGGEEEIELPMLDLNTIANATDNFSIRNKLGQGGFGPVYKGKLIDGQEIAVKRLSRSSCQGLKEFKNEVILITKLQHRNLVRLLGCCIHKDEKMLIYEYMPNKSLDYFLFDQTRSKLLDWNKRVHIINGIARGLLYLHQDSRLKIIHRDLKVSNVLLDNEMNPKISDFGLARTFGGDQTEANTNRVVGTYGYMSPEYALDGLFSVKSDVFSFGVMVLEMVSGKKSRGFTNPDHDLNLLSHAWTLWTNASPLELIEEGMVESCNQSEALRCIHVALLCVQQRPENRPDMATVVLMMGGENPLPDPQQPGFFTATNTPELSTSQSKTHQSYTTNEVTMTELEAR